MAEAPLFLYHVKTYSVPPAGPRVTSLKYRGCHTKLFFGLCFSKVPSRCSTVLSVAPSSSTSSPPSSSSRSSSSSSSSSSISSSPKESRVESALGALAAAVAEEWFVDTADTLLANAAFLRASFGSDVALRKAFGLIFFLRSPFIQTPLTTSYSNLAAVERQFIQSMRSSTVFTRRITSLSPPVTPLSPPSSWSRKLNEWPCVWVKSEDGPASPSLDSASHSFIGTPRIPSGSWARYILKSSVRYARERGDDKSCIPHIDVVSWHLREDAPFFLYQKSVWVYTSPSSPCCARVESLNHRSCQVLCRAGLFFSIQPSLYRFARSACNASSSSSILRCSYSSSSSRINSRLTSSSDLRTLSTSSTLEVRPASDFWNCWCLSCGIGDDEDSCIDAPRISGTVAMLNSFLDRVDFFCVRPRLQ